ncbi:winged helix DNA-binding domain-containing protein [Nocardioides aestuarii]|uniref:Winged helix DNA-binding domain-containing protein n=1 Tax=Nocardioides aestuarii TaxID=252231 RepID=A0ABW4TLZ3_9ACTN
MPVTLDDRTIARWRLRSQHLVAPYAAGAAGIVDHPLAVQAENPSQSAWAVGSRTAASDPADLADLLHSGAVLRTHVLRPTWHYVAAADVRWLVELTAPRVRKTYAARLAGGLDGEAAVLLDALAEGAPLDRPALAARLEEAGRPLTGMQLMLLLADLEMQRLVVSGPPANGVHTYAPFDDRVHGARSLDREEALAELARRYVTGHGPATERDLAYWATLTLTDVRRGLAAAGDAIASFEHGGRTYRYAPDQSPPARVEPAGHLLQILDEMYRGYQDSRMVLDTAGAVPTGRETAIGMALVDGQLVASMKREVGRDRVTFTLTPYASWTPACAAAVEDAAARYGAFLGLDPVVAHNRT